MERARAAMGWKEAQNRIFKGEKNVMQLTSKCAYNAVE
jgi:hypothetical protein